MQANKAAGGHSPTTDDETYRRPDGSLLRSTGQAAAPRQVDGGGVRGRTGAVRDGDGDGAVASLGCVRRRLGGRIKLGARHGRGGAAPAGGSGWTLVLDARDLVAVGAWRSVEERSRRASGGRARGAHCCRAEGEDCARPDPPGERGSDGARGIAQAERRSEVRMSHQKIIHSSVFLVLGETVASYGCQAKQALKLL